VSTRALALLGLATFILLGALIGSLGVRGATDIAGQPPSTYLAGPGGGSGLAEALERMGVRVTRLRRTWRTLEPATDPEGTLLAVLAPSQPITPREVELLRKRAVTTGPVLLAGTGVDVAMGCWGWRSILRGVDSIPVRLPGGTRAGAPAWTRRILVPAPRLTDSATAEEVARSSACASFRGVTDTLVVTAGNRPVLVRVVPKRGHPVYLLSDASLLGNRSLRRTAAGPFALAFFARAGTGVMFDEFHHGYDESGNLFQAAYAWSLGTPWGWAAWQLLAVGIVALLVAAVRTGPTRTVIVRARRSSIEHVRALATALQAARGHDVAVDLLIRGLRRRLSRDARPGREPVGAWIGSLASRVRTAPARAAATRLMTLTRPGRSVDDVLAAAHAVEDVWQDLRP
jgi:hypothetical protein